MPRVDLKDVCLSNALLSITVGGLHNINVTKTTKNEDYVLILRTVMKWNFIKKNLHELV
jgi:hypothetical protein